MPEINWTAFGNDRVERGDGDEITLIALHDKGWVARQFRARGGADHPGTCVDWNDTLFEVILAQPSPGGVKYVLRPWCETDTIRTMARYEAVTEAALHATRVDNRTRDRTGRLITWLAPLTGHAPGSMQQRWERDYGVSGSLITAISAGLLLIPGGIALIAQMASGFGGTEAGLGIPVGFRLLGSYLFFESLVRIGVMLTQGLPMGSLAGGLIAIVWTATTQRKKTKQRIGDRTPQRDLGNMVSREISRALETGGRADGPRARGVFDVEIDDETRRRDLYLMTEGLLSLLAPSEQIELQRRWGFDPIRWGRLTAGTILAFAGLGLAAGVPKLFEMGGGSTFLSALIAGFVAVEQISRFARLNQNKPAGSIFGIVVRPFVAKLFEEEPKDSTPQSK